MNRPGVTVTASGKPGAVRCLNGFTPYEYICKAWASEPDRCIADPIHQRPGLNTRRGCSTFALISAFSASGGRAGNAAKERHCHQAKKHERQADFQR